MQQTTSISDQIVKKINTEKQFHFAKSALDNKQNIYVDNKHHPKVYILYVQAYTYIFGRIANEQLREIYNLHERPTYSIVTDNRHTLSALKKLGGTEYTRYSFDASSLSKEKLQVIIDTTPTKYKIKKLTTKMEFEQLMKCKSLFTIGDKYSYEDYKRHHIVTYLALDKGEIIGAMGSNIVYQDGLETQLFVDENYRKQNLATILSAKFCLDLLEQKRIPYWDAANEISCHLAKKLGYTYLGEYTVLKQEWKDILPQIDNK